MRPTTKRHLLKTARRTFRLTITEYPSHVSLSIIPSRTGNLDDVEVLAAWLGPILAPYDADPRPIELSHPLDCWTQTIWGNASGSTCVTRIPPVSLN